MCDLSLKLESIHNIFQVQPRCLDLIKDLMISLIQNPIPQETIMITFEFHDLNTCVCEIIASVSKEQRYLGRREKYSDCVYSRYSDSINRVIIIERVKEQPGYLSLNDQVKSEVFFEFTFADSINFILNAEFSSDHVSDSVKQWFSQMIGIFSKKKNKLDIQVTDNREKED